MPKRKSQTQKTSVDLTKSTKLNDERNASEDEGASVSATVDPEPVLSTAADNSPGASAPSRCDTRKKEQDNEDIYISPSKIRFSQETVSYKFGDGKKLSDTLEALKSGSVTVEDIPRITVVKSSGGNFTRDNRRLCVFQKFEAHIGHQFPIPVIIGENLGRRRFTTTTSGKSVKIMQNRKVIETWS